MGDIEKVLNDVGLITLEEAKAWSIFNDIKALVAASQLLGVNILDIRAFGAVGDGVTDDTSAINAAITAAVATNGKSILISQGVFRFTSQIKITSALNIFGMGVVSALMPDLNSATVDAIVVNGTGNAPLTNVKLSNFSILSNKTNACRDTLVLQRLDQGSEVDLWVNAKSARYQVRLAGCIGVRRMKLVSSVNVAYPYASGMSAADTIRMPFESVSGSGCNACDIEVIVEGGNGNGFYIENQMGQMSSKLRGIIEGVGGANAFYAEGCGNMALVGMYFEGNTGNAQLKICNNCFMGDGIVFSISDSGAGGNITLTGCDHIEFGAGTANSLTLDSACSFIDISSAFRYVTLTDPANQARTRTGVIHNITASTPSGTPITIIDLGGTLQPGMFIVFATIPSGGTGYQAAAIALTDGVTTSLTTIRNGATLTLTLSGNQVQATQTSGASFPINYTILPAGY